MPTGRRSYELFCELFFGAAKEGAEGADYCAREQHDDGYQD